MLSEADKTLEIDNTVLKPSTVVWNLGVLLDEQLSVDANARQCVKTCFFHLRRIRQLRPIATSTMPMRHCTR